MDVEKWTGRRLLCGRKGVACHLNEESQVVHRVKRGKGQLWTQPTEPTRDKKLNEYLRCGVETELKYLDEGWTCGLHAGD